MILNAVGDTIGYKNSEWEFNYGKKVDQYFSDDILYEFISLGGIQLDLKGWIVSDDTIMHIEVDAHNPKESRISSLTLHFKN